MSVEKKDDDIKKKGNARMEERRCDMFTVTVMIWY